MKYGNISIELERLSFRIASLQQGLKSKFGIEKCHIGAGSSRAILDHFYFGKPLKMRDLDVFAIRGQQVTKEFATTIGRTLESEELGAFKSEELRQRPRARIISKNKIEGGYNAGYGFFWINENQDIIDLSIFHTAEDLQLNGLLDVDRIILPLEAGVTLVDFLASKVGCYSAEQISDSGVIEDRFQGYASWIKGSASFINSNELERDPIVATIRSTRAYAKLNQDLPDEFIKRVQDKIATIEIRDEFQWIRNVSKLLDDEDPIRELKNIERAGVIKQLSPQYQSKLQDLMGASRDRGYKLIRDYRQFFRSVENSMKHAVTMGA